MKKEDIKQLIKSGEMVTATPPEDAWVEHGSVYWKNKEGKTKEIKQKER